MNIMNIDGPNAYSNDSLECFGSAAKNGSALFLGRIENQDGTPIISTDIESAEYAVYSLDTSDVNNVTPVTGHDSVVLNVASIVTDSLTVDAIWPYDELGYNFKHQLDVTTDQAFTMAGKHYRVEFRFTPHVGQVIIARYRVYVE